MAEATLESLLVETPSPHRRALELPARHFSGLAFTRERAQAPLALTALGDSAMIKTASPCGPVAQLGERLNGIQEVRGSSPLGSTKFFKEARALATA